MEKTEGIVIKCKDYRETSQLVWLYTKDFGKIKFIAKGSRVKTKKFKGKIDLFNVIDVVFYKHTRGELHTLSELYVLGTFNKIRQDLDRLTTASYFAELIDATTGLEDPSNKIYSLIMDVFKWLEDGKEPEFLRCVFELRLLKYLGNLPSIENVSRGVKAIVDRILESRAIDKLRISPTQLKELKDVLRLVIDYSVGKRLKSLEFMEELSHGIAK